MSSINSCRSRSMKLGQSGYLKKFIATSIDLKKSRNYREKRKRKLIDVLLINSERTTKVEEEKEGCGFLPCFCCS